MAIPSRRFILSALAAALAVPFSGCGGGGGTVGAGPAADGAAPSEERLSTAAPPTIAAILRAARVLSLRSLASTDANFAYTDALTAGERDGISPAKAAAAAGNRPLNNLGHSRRGRTIGGVVDADGGVSQSSQGAHGWGFDVIDVDVDANFRNQLSWEVSYKWVASLADAPTTWAFDSDTAGASGFMGWTAANERRGGLFHRSAPGGSVWLAVRSDIRNMHDTDWMATGMWAYTPANGAAADYRFGVFADGGDPFRGASVSGLTGVATYTGRATGLYSRASASGSNNDFFEATADLSVEWDPGRGTIDGRVHGFTVGGAAIAGNPEITLSEASIDTKARFPGSATMTFGGRTWSGRWSGQFYGNPQVSGALPMPESAGGTFGVTAGGATDRGTFLGAFETHLDSFNFAP